MGNFERRAGGVIIRAPPSFVPPPSFPPSSSIFFFLLRNRVFRNLKVEIRISPNKVISREAFRENFPLLAIPFPFRISGRRKEVKGRHWHLRRPEIALIALSRHHTRPLHCHTPTNRRRLFFFLLLLSPQAKKTPAFRVMVMPSRDNEFLLRSLSPFFEVF